MLFLWPPIIDKTIIIRAAHLSFIGTLDNDYQFITKLQLTPGIVAGTNVPTDRHICNPVGAVESSLPADIPGEQLQIIMLYTP